MKDMIRKGKVWKFGDNVDTDQIYPGKYMHIHEPAEAAKHLMEGASVQFAQKVKEGDFLIAGRNFGLGSIRGGIHLAFEHLKLGGIIAESFSRAFFRNCISEGIPILECPEVTSKFSTGDIVEVNFSRGEIKNLTRNEVIRANKLPNFIIEKIVSGGSIALVKKLFSADLQVGEKED